MSPGDTTARAAALQSLIRLETPLRDALETLSEFSWDWENGPLRTITRPDVSSILKRWTCGQMTSGEVEDWASALECRDDVSFDSDHTREAIFELANPELSAANALDDIAARYSTTYSAPPA